MIPKDRRDESRELMVKAFYFALGMYAEQESKKDDQWRDQSLNDIFAHTSHEMGEIRNNIKKGMSMTYLVHNCADLVGLSCTLLAHVMEKADMNEKHKQE